MHRSPFLALACSAIVLLAACGDDSSTDTDTAATTTPASVPATLPAIEPGTTPTPDQLPKPEVKFPAAAVTTLTTTDLIKGSGRAAATGDTVVVHYVGVRSIDGVEFDNSFERGQPFPVALGTGGVIKGWDDGLVGAQKGMRRQLDIPWALAYGEQEKSDVIKAKTDLTFVIDVLGVIAKPDPATKPTAAPKASTGATEVAIEELKAGEGDEIQRKQTVYFNVVAYRGDTLEVLDDSWENGAPASLPYDPTQMFPGLLEAFDGMRIGGQRLVTIPAAQIFDGAGNQNFNLPPGVDFIMLIDVVEAF